jgi:hypothetical protein
MQFVRTGSVKKWGGPLVRPHCWLKRKDQTVREVFALW